MRLIKYLFLLVMLFIVASASSQYTTKHYIAPSPWSYFSRYNELVITTLSATPVAVTIANSSGTVYTNSATTVAGAPLRYRFPATDASANLSGVVLSGQGLYVSASVPVGVQVRNIASDNYTYSGLGPGDLTSCVQKGNSAFTSLGDQGLGTSFRLGYYANVTGQTCYSAETGAPLYSVLAISNNTSVYVNGILLKTLQAGQSYLFQANIGSLVTSNNNIVVNTGMRGDNSSGCADGVESQVIPTNNLGTTYVVVRSKGNTGYEKTTIVATQALTTVTVRVPSTNSTNTYTLSNAGDYVTINNGDGSNAYTTNYITTTAPVAVYTGSADGCEIDMIVQPPLSSCSGSFDVQTNQFLSNANDGNSALPYFGYIVIQSDTAIVWFNGTNLESIVGNRTQIGTSGYYIIKYTSTQLGNPSNLRFVVNARINAALIESGAGYSMSAFISSISNAMPPPSASSSCLPTTFTAQGGFSSYQWYKDGVLISGATSQTYSPSVAGSYSVAGTTASCGTTAQSTSVLVNPKPNAGSDFVACANQVDTLTATSTISGGSWIALPTNPAGATLSNTTNNVSTVSFSNTAGGTYQFAFSVGCSDTLTATINPLPTIAAITGTTSVCLGNTSTLSNTTTGGVWSSATPSVATINSNGLVTALGVGSTIISYTVTNANGCTNSVTTTVTVNALPTVAAITGTTSACVGASTTLSNSTTGGVWSSATPSVATVNTSGVVTGVSAGRSVISYTVTNANGCVTTVNTTVTINALPVVPAITGNLNVCVGATTTLSNTTSGGVWSSSNKSVATVNASGVVTGVNNGTSVITYTVTNANGCVTSVNATITVNPLPSVASISGTNSICAGTTTTFSNTTSGGVWSSGTSSVATINASGVITGINAGSSVITYTYTNANGCSNSTTRTVTVNAQPTVAAITGTNNLCLGSGTVTLGNTTSGGSWSSSNTSVATISSAGVVTGVASGATTISYTVNGSGGCSTTQTLVFTVKATSASTTNASICAGGSYTFNGTVYTTAGTYTKILVNAVGCDSIATLNLTVKPVSASTTNISICPSALPYTWNGLTFSAAGTQTAHLTNYVGCDSAATLVLTVKATSASTTNASICAGGSYTFNGTVYTTAGTYTKTLVNAVGCDSIATLNLTVKATSASTTNTSICPSALPYSWNGLTLSSAGTYTKTLTNAVGCDSVATLVLTVKATSASTTTAILCAGSTYSFNGVTYSAPGTYVAHLTNYVGCDSAATLLLVGGAATASTTTMSICPSALPYSWNGLTFTGAGSQTAHLINASGCDSAATLVLTVKAALTSTTNATICGGNSYLFNGVTYTTSGTYNAYLASGLGCDSIATLVLTVLPKPNAGVDKIVGYNNGNASVTLSGVGAGVWLANTTNTGSSVIVDPTSATTAITTFSTIGTYEYLYINGACSDTMKVSVLPNGNISSYVWVDTNEDGINNESTTNGINNVVIELYKEDANGNYVLAQTTTTATYNGKPGYCNFVIPENGNYKVKFPLVAQYGALTTQNLSTNTNNNSVADSATGFSPVIAINTTGSGLSLNNTTVGAGYKYVASPNCNMTATIGVNQLSQCVTNNQYQFTGNFTGGTAPFTYLWDLNDGNYANTKDVTHTYATAGEHDVTFIVKDSRGCEAHASTIQIAVGAKPKASFDIYTHNGNGDGFTFVSTSTINAGWMTYSWNLGNGTTSTLINPMTTYSPGTYTVTLVVTGNFGCSDTITKVITVDSSNNYCSGPLANFSVNNIAQCLSGNSFVFTNTSTGNNNTYTWNLGDGTAASSDLNEQHTFTNTGTYNITLTATNTCGTNTVTKTITVNGVPATPSAITGPSTVALGGVIGLSNATTGGVWSSSNTAVATINNYGIVTGITAGNTVITYTVANTCGTTSVSMPITVLAANSNCIAPLANFTVNTNIQCLLGNNFIFSHSASGTLLTYNWKFGDGVTANSANASHSFTQAGVYNVKLIVSNTCGTDSITKTITVNAAPNQPQAIIGNNSIATGGTTLLSTTTTGGVWSSSNTAIATVSANGLVTGVASGSATITYTVTNTCGSASVSKIILVSQPCVSTSSTTTASICAGNSYTFNGTAYTAAGTYVANLTNASGCDSVATLVLTIKQPTSSTTTASICAGNSYTFNGITYTTAGTYTARLTNSVGCDSIATLVLTVNSLPTQPQSITGNASAIVGNTSQLASITSGGIWSSSNTSVATINSSGWVTAVSVGNIIITYTVSNGCGSANVTLNFSVIAAPSNGCNSLKASFSVNNTKQCITDNRFVFTNTTTGGTAPYTYLWEISQDNKYSTKDATVTFSKYGDAQAKLKVIDSRGCESESDEVKLLIGARPVANFSVLNNTGSGQSKTFISASTIASGNLSYLWDFGNGLTSTQVNPTITYARGTYTAKLVVSGVGSCKDSVSQVINEVGLVSVSVYPNPVINTVQVNCTSASTSQTLVKLVDLNGRIIQTQTFVPAYIGANINASFDVRNLQPGSYIIQVSDSENGLLSNKVILKQ